MSDDQHEAQNTSPREEPDAEGMAAVAVPLGLCDFLAVFVASKVAAETRGTPVLRSCLKDAKSRGQGETLTRRKVAFGNTITKRYDYHTTRSLLKPVRWHSGRAEKAKWHAQLARMIANELCREVFSGLDGLIFAVQKSSHGSSTADLDSI